MIPVTQPFLPPKEEYNHLLHGIWERRWLTNMGPLASELEMKLKSHLEINHILFVGNGTIALQMAIKALELKGEIITTPFTYVATSSSIVWEGCKPVYVDIDSKSLNIDPNKIESAITEKTTAIIATAPVINAKKSEISYAIANMTVFGVLAMLIYPYFANFYFEGDPMFVGLFLGTAIHETSQVAAAGLIYDQQFNSPETLNISTVTKLIRNTFLVIMIPLFAYLYNRGQEHQKNYSIINIFPYFVLGFIALIILRNVGDAFFLQTNISGKEMWVEFVDFVKSSAKIFLSMAMAAVGLSTNLKDLKSMGYEPFVVGFVSLLTVGVVSLTAIEFFNNLILN